MMGKLAAWLAGKPGSPLFFAFLSGALYLLGWLNGLGFEQNRRDKAELVSVRAEMTAYRAQLAKAEAISLAHLEKLQQTEKSHEQSTRTLRRALSETAAMRTDCRLSFDLMQQLQAARNAAARAVTGGTGAALPAAGRP